MDLNEKAKYNIEFLKSNIGKIKLPLYNVKGAHDTYIIKEFKKINNSYIIIYINTKDKEFHLNIYDVNFIFLESIYRKVLDQFKNKNIWED
jgi:hypothetical protein